MPPERISGTESSCQGGHLHVTFSLTNSKLSWDADCQVWALLQVKSQVLFKGKIAQGYVNRLRVRSSVCIPMCVCVCPSPARQASTVLCSLTPASPPTPTWNLPPVPASGLASNCGTYPWDEQFLQKRYANQKKTALESWSEKGLGATPDHIRTVHLRQLFCMIMLPGVPDQMHRPLDDASLTPKGCKLSSPDVLPL